MVTNHQKLKISSFELMMFVIKTVIFDFDECVFEGRRKGSKVFSDLLNVMCELARTQAINISVLSEFDLSLNNINVGLLTTRNTHERCHRNLFCSDVNYLFVDFSF